MKMDQKIPLVRLKRFDSDTLFLDISFEMKFNLWNMNNLKILVPLKPNSTVFKPSGGWKVNDG